MSEESGGGLTDKVLTAAAAGLLAVSAVAARLDAAPSGAGTELRQRARRSGAGVGAGSPLRLKAQGIKGNVERFQARFKPAAFLYGVIKRFGDDKASRLAALVAYYGFFSLFPALLAMVTILGFVLDGYPSLRSTIQDSALAQFPIIGGDNIGKLSGSTWGLIVGLAGALWAGLGAMQASQEGLNTVWRNPQTVRPTFFKKRLRSLAALTVLATLFAVNSVVPQIAGAFTSGPVAFVLLLVASSAMDAVAFLVMFQILTARQQRWRDLWVGAVVAGIGYALLQTFGALYVTRTLKGAQDTYGQFASVIALLSWLYLLAQVTMFAAVINVVRAEHAWPRSLFEPKDQVATQSGRAVGR